MRFAHPINPRSSFAQELREERQRGMEEGMEKGMEQGLELDKLDVIRGMLDKGGDWSFMESIVHLDQAGYEALKRKHDSTLSG